MATVAQRQRLHEDESALGPQVTTVPVARKGSPSYQAYQILKWGFVALPIIAGADKFIHYLVHWDKYLAPWVARLSPIGMEGFMRVVGGVEIVAGLLVAVKPRFGGYVVAAWLMGIVINLVTYPGYYDIALRDFGLALGALALARLSETYDRT